MENRMLKKIGTINDGWSNKVSYGAYIFSDHKKKE